jgi:starch synthase
VPIVRRTGGLRDTVKDIGEINGYGVCFNNATVGEITNAIYRAVTLYEDTKKMEAITEQLMNLDFSWETSAQQYIEVYQSLR